MFSTGYSRIHQRGSFFAVEGFDQWMGPFHVDWLITCLCDSSRCFIKTATTTLTRTNWAIKTKITKKIGAIMLDTQQLRTQSVVSSQLSRRVSFMMPFQLSPVATRNNVKKAIPKLAKWACSPSPWQGSSSLHSVRNKNNKINSFRSIFRLICCCHAWVLFFFLCLTFITATIRVENWTPRL